MVRLYEPAPPEGDKAIEWVLLTTLPIRTAKQVERVVDIYRQRWLIEEFNKVVKTGCSYRKRHLTNKHSIVNTLATCLPIAWKALLIHQMAQSLIQISATSVLSPVELKVLKAKARQINWKLSRHPTAQDVLLFLANLGGYRKSKRPPGWQLLMAGIEKLNVLVQGWQLAAEM